MPEKTHQAAEMIRGAYTSGAPCEPLRHLFPEGSIEHAYAVQEINTEIWCKAGRRIVGRKVGLTSRAVQAQLAVGEPDYGMLYADMAYADGDEIPLGSVLQPRAEAEVAFVLARDLRFERHTVADIVSAVAYALPAIEVAGSRIANWNITIVDTIADNASSGLFVLGTRPCQLGSFDLALCGMVIERRGEAISLGCGQACLGNPLNSARWLADVMVAVGRPLKEGDTILTGALGPLAPVKAGDVIKARINGLGAVRAIFT